MPWQSEASLPQHFNVLVMFGLISPACEAQDGKNLPLGSVLRLTTNTSPEVEVL